MGKPLRGLTMRNPSALRRVYTSEAIFAPGLEESVRFPRAVPMTSLGRLVVIPTDPIELQERTGYDWLERYYNPGGAFREVIALSPLERGRRNAHGMTIQGVSPDDFKSALRKIRPDVVRAYGGFWPADLACLNRLWNVPVVVSVHDKSPALFHDSVRYADLVLCTSKAVQRLALDRGVSLDRTRILPNRVDSAIFRPVRDEAAFEALNRRFPPGKRLLLVGRVVREKNHDTLIRALALLPRDYIAIFVGLGDRSPLTLLAKSLDVARRCFWVDAVKNSELPVWYSWCDVMCTPSRSEGFGIVFIEAAACGAPIVTSNMAPMNEYLTHGVSAHLVDDFEDPSALAAALRRVCEDPAYRASLGSNAIEAAKPFEKAAVDAAEVALYREAISLPRLSLQRRFELAVWRVRARTPSAFKPDWARRLVRAAEGRRSG